ncbi:MAG: cytochrome c family protein [Proteobacteria bacterium]|nr:cytochrome c family protein [Pseudomonadota bacterium]
MRRLILMASGAAMVFGFAYGPAQAAGNPAEGEKTFRRVCTACHIATKDGPKRLGPSLFGIVGRPSGSVEGFRYSEANKKANVTWTPEVLEKYLADPKAMIPGTIMAFAGLKKAEERADIITYLQTLK